MVQGKGIELCRQFGVQRSTPLVSCRILGSARLARSEQRRPWNREQQTGWVTAMGLGDASSSRPQTTEWSATRVTTACSAHPRQRAVDSERSTAWEQAAASVARLRDCC